MKITVFGTWYVGLVTGTCLAEVWHEVMCIDIDDTKIENLKKGIIPIYEPWLEELVLRNHKEKRLVFSTDAQEWVNFWNVIFCAVWTPPDKNHKADLKYVKAVAKTVANYMSDYKVFINKSTVPVGTGEICKKIIAQNPWKIDFDIVSNPEFLKEWMAVRDFMSPDRIVCGVESRKAEMILNDVYKPFIRTDRPLIIMSIKSAEITKYAANAFLATKISFINEIANFSEIVWADISEISKGIGLDDRIGTRFLHAGIWYGGSCFPKDVHALIETWKEYNFNFQIIQATQSVNKTQKTKVVEKLLNIIPDITGKTITLWGIAFKPKTDDIRDAPSLDIIQKLLKLWVEKIQCFDPVAMKHIERIYENNPKIQFYHTSYDALKISDALLMLTEWDEFRMVDFERIKILMRGNIIIDGRNIWSKQDIEKHDFIYQWIWK